MSAAADVSVLHVDDKVYAVLGERGELLSVPHGTTTGALTGGSTGPSTILFWATTTSGSRRHIVGPDRVGAGPREQTSRSAGEMSGRCGDDPMEVV